jgi:hypothetical protein
MRVPRPQDTALPTPAPADERCDAFALLGLDPAADAGLVELSYRRQIELCRRTLPEGPARQTWLAELGRARRLLARPAEPASEVAAPHTGPRPPSDRSEPDRRPSPLSPYQVLRVLPHADAELITIAYRHLLGIAAAANDAAAFEALECAYARIGTPAARAAFDRGTASPSGEGGDDPGAAPHRSRSRAWYAPTLRAAGTLTTGGLLPWSSRTARSAWHGLSEARLTLPRPARDHRSRALSEPTRELPGPSAPRPGKDWDPGAPDVAHPIGALRVVEGEREVVTLMLRDQAAYTIGAGASSAIRLPAAGAGTVAAEHARITVGHGWVLFQHLAERGVSLVNGRATARALLSPGDHVDIGPYRCHYFVARYEPRQWRV